ncbi:esterase-like activity of phytase family protein [Nakamurella sp. A5-74]|uniref:Esterase-like activity of phytase family protein n=1 Tax=Nakamurella sp. A5-74 TaxID=3158264 RepID=A0AAU8DRI2_9ACTN
MSRPLPFVRRRLRAGTAVGVTAAIVGAAALIPALTVGTVVAPVGSGPAAAHVASWPLPPQPPRPGAARAAVTLYAENVAPLATIGGVQIGGSAFGSSFTKAPWGSDLYYGLTDRGPNVDGPNATKIEPLPDFNPAIGEFALVGSGSRAHAVLLRTIPLRAADGSGYNGRVSLAGGTGETITDLTGTALDPSPYGYDPEGLAVLRDGTFWVSDEYGPFITHFDRTGRQLERLSPFDGSLPVELSLRDPNKGMEGLTVTPDGRMLVGIMQAALNAPDGPKSKNVPVVRIVTVDLASRQTHEYLYALHAGDSVGTTVSEIAALNAHEFLVDERDSAKEPAANKKLYRIDLRGATDVSKHAQVPNATYREVHGGLLVGGRTIEAIAGKNSTATATANLAAVGVTPATSRLFLDIGGLVTAIAPDGSFFGHDKVEGVAVVDGGRSVVLSNDSDFGIDGTTTTTPPFGLQAKILPNGRQDSGELLKVDLAKVPAEYRR